MSSYGQEVGSDSLFWAEGHPADISQLQNCAYLNYSNIGYVQSRKFVYIWFHIKGTWSVHSFNEDFLSLSPQVSMGTFFMKSPVYNRVENKQLFLSILAGWVSLLSLIYHFTISEAIWHTLI